MNQVNSLLHFYTDGAIPADLSHRCVYVQRNVDNVFARLAQQGHHISIVGARTMGKTSLVCRSVKYLESKGIKLALVDVSSSILPRPESSSLWMFKLCKAVARQLEVTVPNLALDPAAFAAEVPGQVLGGLLADLLNAAGNTRRLIIALDEIDSLRGLPYVDEIISTFRSLRLRRGLADRISFCTVGTVSLTAFAHSTEGSAWNFGSPLVMKDFQENDAAVVRSIAQGFPLSVPRRNAVVRAILSETGGQPYLTMALAEMVAIKGARSPNEVRGLAGELADNLGRPRGGLFHKIGEFLEHDTEGINAINTYRRILRNSDGSCTPEPNNPAKALLLRSGLIRENEEHRLEVKCQIFREYFNEQWAYKVHSKAAREHQQFRGTLSKGTNRKVLIINKGGTLGMVYKQGEVVKPENAEDFIKFFPELRPELDAGNLHYHHINPDDSINIYPEDWIELAEYIYQNRNKGYSGVVVCHGTDTMAYTASAIAFALGPALSFPVVFTGAQTTPDVSHGDARTNLYRACLVAQREIPEVVISFHDHVFRAVRAQKRDDRKFEGFESPTYPPLAEIAGDVKVNSKYLRISQRQAKRRQRDFKLRAEFATGVLQVSQYPGLEPEFFDRHLRQPGDPDLPACKGIIIQTLGAGNVANREPYSFIPFVDRAKEAGIPVIITSQYPPAPGSHTKYGPAMAPLKSGAIHTGNMTVSAAVTKFRWVLAQADEMQRQKTWSDKEKLGVVEKMMAEDYVGELDSGKPKRGRTGVREQSRLPKSMTKTTRTG